MEQKREMVRFAEAKGANIAAIARAFGVERATVYKWLKRYREGGEEAILEMRDKTHWGARKIARRLARDGVEVHKNTVHNVLRRHGRLDTTAAESHTPYIRFEHPEPNDLWQMDFKGPVRTGSGPCHPLTALDDHSRFSLCLAACLNQTTITVQQRLTEVFTRYGLPRRITMDNGSPWGDEGGPRLTKLTAWIVRLGVAVSHSRPYHPQTQGKDERFHKSLDDELLRWITFHDVADLQRNFDIWRDRYNFERPHEALGDEPPVSRYQPSARRMPDPLPPIEYGSGDHVRKVDAYGCVSFSGRKVRVGKGCAGSPVAFRSTVEDGTWDVFFCHQRIMRVDLSEPSP